MAVEREVLQDITKYKAKFFGPLTKRQAICTGIAGLWSLVMHSLLAETFVSKVVVVACCIVGIPALLCGFVEPYDMPMELFALNAIKSFKAPPVRKYKESEMELKYNYSHKKVMAEAAAEEAKDRELMAQKREKEKLARISRKESLTEYPALRNTGQKGKKKK